MKNRLLSIFAALMLVFACASVLAACNKVDFKLNFIVDGEICETINTNGGEVIRMPKNPEKEDYDFKGWFWDEGVWEKPFTANSLLDAPLSSDMSVYAKFDPKHEHNYTAEVTAPTCTEQGYTTYVCECGNSYVSEQTSKLGHLYTKRIVEPTCMVQGYTLYTCERCGVSYKEDYTDPSGHEFTNYVSDDNATFEQDGTKTAYCNHGCGTKDTVTDVGSKLVVSGGITFKSLTVNDNEVYGKMPNDVTEYSFEDEIATSGKVSFEVSSDEYGNQTYLTKKIPLAEGDNIVYVFATQNGKIFETYRVNVYRRRMLTVAFDEKGGSAVGDQKVEEDGFASLPSETQKPGYTFINWDFDFAAPITDNVTIPAVWRANEDTPYKVGYYLENLDDSYYTLVDTVSLSGTTDTVATAEIKTYEHFTPYWNVVTGNIDGDGSTELNVYYQRDRYSVSISATESVSLDKTINGTYKYGAVIGDVTAAFDGYIGYEWTGWYSGGKLYTAEKTLPGFTVESSVGYTATAKVSPEYEPFAFTSTQSTCAVTGVKDKTVEELCIPEGVTSIGYTAFDGCNDLTILKWNAVDCTNTGSYNSIFDVCKKLTTVIIGENVNVMPRNAFLFCNSLTSVYHEGDVAGWCNISFLSPFANPLCNGADLYIKENGEYKLVTDLVIPDGFTSIGYAAFYNCSSLTSVTIPDGVTSIGNDAFENCNNITSVICPAFALNHIPHTKIETAVITSGSEIERAFYDCGNLTSVVIPDSVTRISSYAFYNCNSLTSVVIPDSVTSIGESAFYGCSSLESITIPFVGAKARLDYNESDYPFGYIFGKEKYEGSYGGTFSNRYYIPSSLKEVIITIGTRKDSILSGNYSIVINNDAFNGCSGLTSITIPDGVTGIGSNAFKECSRITSVIIPDSVKSIGSYAFSYCSSLTSITIPDSVTSIGSYAFSYCSSLTSVTIGDSVTSIGGNAFDYCSTLTSVTIGNSVTSIGDAAFYDCYKLVEVYNKSSLNIMKGSDSYGYVGYYAKNVYTPTSGESKLSTDENGYVIHTDGHDVILIRYTGDETKLVLPENITEIYRYAFSNCRSLTSVTIPDSVTYIGGYAFAGCSSLTSVTIPDSVTYIGEYAFNGCTGLTSVTIPDSVTSIGYYAFYNCSSLTSVTIPDSVTSIGYYAFYNCSSLTSVTIGENVRGIGYNAFGNCNKLVEVYNKSSLDITKGSDSYGYVGYYAKNVYTPTSGESKLSTDENGYVIYTDGHDIILFGYTGDETKLVLPESITEIYQYAFIDCSSLTSVTIPEGVTSIGGGAFFGCSSLTNVVVPDSVTSIGSEAFYNCSSLTSIDIPDSVTSIGRYAFYGCSSLTSVTIGDGVTSIGSLAFSFCSSLTSVTFENADGWYICNDPEATSGTEVDVTDPGENANYLKSTYVFMWWKRG